MTRPPVKLVCPSCGEPSQDGALCQGDGSCTAELEKALGDVAGLVAATRRVDDHAWVPPGTTGARWCDQHGCWETDRPIVGRRTSPYDSLPGVTGAALAGYEGMARIVRPAVGAREPDDDDDLAIAVKVQPLPWDEGISKAVRRLRTVLVAWVRLTVEELRIPDVRLAGPACLLCTHTSCRSARVGGWPADTLPAMARWLLGRSSWLRRHPAADELLTDLASAVRRLERSMDRAPELLYAGPCTAEIDDDGTVRECSHDLYAVPGSETVDCLACRATYQVADRREWLQKAAADLLLTATEVSRALTGLGSPVTPDRIRQWKVRGRLTPRGTVQSGERTDPTYRVGDVQDLLLEDARAAERRAARPAKSAASA